jgi:hypothetical protein
MGAALSFPVTGGFAANNSLLIAEAWMPIIAPPCKSRFSI